MTRIIGHLSVAELGQRHRAAQDATEARHTRAIWLLAQGRGVLDVAGVLGFAPRWVEQLAARCNAQGAGALGDRRRGNGRAARVLTTAVLAALAERLRAPPEDGARWTGAKVATWMAAQLGLERVRPQRGWEALTRIGWSVQAPRPQAPRPRHPRAATPEQRAAFKATVLSVKRCFDLLWSDTGRSASRLSLRDTAFGGFGLDPLRPVSVLALVGSNAVFKRFAMAPWS